MPLPKHMRIGLTFDLAIDTNLLLSTRIVTDYYTPILPTNFEASEVRQTRQTQSQKSHLKGISYLNIRAMPIIMITVQKLCQRVFRYAGQRPRSRLLVLAGKEKIWPSPMTKAVIPKVKKFSMNRKALLLEMYMWNMKPNFKWSKRCDKG